MSKAKHVVIVGAGMVGLCTAWFLQERGVRVTVLERTRVAAGASWGNAGWIAPALTLPLPDPAIFRFGMKAMLSPDSPVYVPFSADRRMVRFLAGFARNSTPARWRDNMVRFAEINRHGLAAFDALEAEGLEQTTRVAEPFLAAFANEPDREVLVHEFDEITARGTEVDYELISGDELRAFEPSVSEAVTLGIRIAGQRFINPPDYMTSLAAAVRARGGQIIEDAAVTGIQDGGPGDVSVLVEAKEAVTADEVVIASGTWLGELAEEFGVRQLVQAGRGYSFTVRPESPPTHPLYFPAQRLACTPLGARLRVGGMMEFRRADAPPDPRRIQTLVRAAAPYFDDVDWEDREDEWVGSRPCTVDGLPLVGTTRSPRVHVSGGHGMWGITLGPLSGRILADRIAGAGDDPLLTMFDPLR